MFCMPNFSARTPNLDAGNFSAETRQQLLWGRDLALGNGDPVRQHGLSLTYCGHTPMRDIQQIGSQVFIDTGAFGPGGKLTIVEPQALRRWSISVEAAREAGAAALACCLSSLLAHLIELEHHIDARAVPVVFQIGRVMAVAQQRGSERGEALAFVIPHRRIHDARRTAPRARHGRAPGRRRSRRATAPRDRAIRRRGYRPRCLAP